MDNLDNISARKLSIKSISSSKAEETEDKRVKHGLSIGLTAYFMIAQMAGAGFLALPRAMANAGWIGIAMLIIFCGSVAFSATRLGSSWIMLEERYPEYRKPARQPYLEIAFRSLGLIGRRIAMVLMLVTNIGATTVFIILISELINSVASNLSICEWALVVAAIVTPMTWLGTPKDFWQASVFAVVSTFLAIVIIIVKIFLDFEANSVYPPATHPNPTISSFSLGFGAILFAFGGSSVFPTIQNDMTDRSQFWKSVIISFIVILIMYFPVALFGYIYIGDAVDDNVILSVIPGPSVTVAIAFEIFNLFGTYIISMSPVFQFLEDTANIPSEFNYKRILLRTGVICGQVFIALAFPDFGMILNLIGGSSMSCLSFILPPLMYMKLVDDKSHKDAPQRTIPLWQRFFLYEIIGMGIIGGLSSTVSALIELLSPESFSSSCFVEFGVAES